MILVMTHDPEVFEGAMDSKEDWNDTLVLWLEENYLQKLQDIDDAEDLCITAHGNDQEIGDEENGPDDWGFSVAFIANMLVNNLPNGYRGNVFISACMNTISNFSVRVRLLLDQNRALMNTSIVGNNRPVGMRIPSRKSVEWQWAKPAGASRQA